MTRFSRPLYSIPLLGFLLACQPDDPANAPCTGQEICTEIFVSVVVTVTTAEGQPVALDRYYTKHIQTGEVFQLQPDATDSLRQANGTYPVVSDAQRDKLAPEGSPLLFVGEKNGSVVVERPYTVGHDCCHIQRISGETDITL
ncbi:hypothetical protein SAMN05421823_10252 [Catalinimonas alkaloidigena]|uniref:Uncharacterized protein n=1 Tax=Catalinimonas alkaloidigena TaxID=1075417 RepID=A0A1G8ZSJ8_9BACT|nr:hypothetical protein [Catalinimonas alkaloidigena]SDK17100.1 hypothetical protein SAMN05421823_10252 [Catalinimonas alkaloidigena]